MIYPAYQRQGIGTLALELITQTEEKVLFVSSKPNPASTAFFQKQHLLNLVTENSRYKVYSS